MKKRSSIFYAPDDAPSFAAGAAAVLAGLPPEDKSPSGGAPVIDKKEEIVTAPEVKPIDDLPENLPNEGRSDAWKNFRKAHTEQRKELTEAKAQLSEFEGTKKERDDLKSRIEAMEGELKGYKEIDSIVKLENSPSFKREFVEPRNQAVATMKELAGYGGVDAMALQSAISLTGKAKLDALETILSDVSSTLLRGKLERVIDQIECLDSKMAQERSNADASIKERDTRAQAKQRENSEQFKAGAKQAFDTVAARLSKELGIDTETIESARKFYESNEDLGAVAERIIKAHVADATVAEKQALKKELEETKTELERYRKGSPGLNGGTGERSGAVTAGMSFIEGAKRALTGV